MVPESIIVLQRDDLKFFHDLNWKRQFNYSDNSWSKNFNVYKWLLREEISTQEVERFPNK